MSEASRPSFSGRHQFDFPGVFDSVYFHAYASGETVFWTCCISMATEGMAGSVPGSEVGLNVAKLVPMACSFLAVLCLHERGSVEVGGPLQKRCDEDPCSDGSKADYSHIKGLFFFWISGCGLSFL